MLPRRPVARAAPSTIRWDDRSLTRAAANRCKVSSTREAVVLGVGTNQAWERGQSEVRVELSRRIILSPFRPSGWPTCSPA